MSVTTLRQPAGHVAGPVFQPQSFAELMKFAEIIQNSDLLPKDYKGKPGNIVLAVQMGSEVGLSPMQAMQGIAVINGRPAIWGDAMMGLVRVSPECENISEKLEGDGDARTATCIAKRRGADPVVSTFSVADAKRAGLFGKQGPWQQYPDRMLKQRARGFALRDAFADVLKGLKTVEELRDYDTPQPRREPPHAGTTIDAKAEPMRESVSATLRGDSIPSLDPEPARPKPADKRSWSERIAALDTRQACVQFLEDKAEARPAYDRLVEDAKAKVRDMLADRMAELERDEPDAPPADGGWPGPDA